MNRKVRLIYRTFDAPLSDGMFEYAEASQKNPSKATASPDQMRE
jgi:hypothetical protein